MSSPPSVESQKTARCTYTSPGASFCSSGPTASGVTSLTAKPVPPVVTTRLIGLAPASAHCSTTASIAALSSPTMRVSTTSQTSAPVECAAKKSRRSWPDASAAGSFAAVVDTTRTATVRVVGDAAGAAGAAVLCSFLCRRWDISGGYAGGRDVLSGGFGGVAVRGGPTPYR